MLQPLKALSFGPFDKSMSYNKTNEPGINLRFLYLTTDEAGDAVLAQPGNLYTLIAENPHASDACYLHFYDADDIADVTVGSTTPVWSVRLHGNSTIQLDRGEFPLKYFKTGICVAATLAITGNTAPSADPQVTLHFQ